jgi:hypothetical protein
MDQDRPEVVATSSQVAWLACYAWKMRASYIGVRPSDRTLQGLYRELSEPAPQGQHACFAQRRRLWLGWLLLSPPIKPADKWRCMPTESSL